MNVLVPPKSGDEVARGVDRMVKLASAAAPVLTPEQRATASTKLQAMAAREASR